MKNKDVFILRVSFFILDKLSGYEFTATSSIYEFFKGMIRPPELPTLYLGLAGRFVPTVKCPSSAPDR